MELQLTQQTLTQHAADGSQKSELIIRFERFPQACVCTMSVHPYKLATRDCQYVVVSVAFCGTLGARGAKRT